MGYKLINIEGAAEGQSALINAHSVSSIYLDTAGAVVVRMSCGWGIITKFTDIEHAADYIQRATTQELISED